GRAVTGRRNPMSPVVTLKVPILQVREVKTGESVGYGAIQSVRRESRLGILGIGYADGLLRSLSSSGNRPGGKVVVHGRRCPLVGRVSMDLVAVDLTDLGPDLPNPGEMVEIFGPNLLIDEQADAAGT